MRDVAEELARWYAGGMSAIALATVVRTFGSSPRRVGAKMALASDGRIAGSVSGGCVESAVIEEARSLVAGGKPKLLHFEANDESAWAVGLPCGGSIDVLVEPLERTCFEFVRARIEANEWAATAIVVNGERELVGRTAAFARTGERAGSIAPELDERVRDAALEMRESGMIEPETGLELFVDVIAPAATLVAVGGVHIAVALVRLAKVLGFRTIVIDPRKSFGNSGRFPDVDRLLQAWPDEAFATMEITPETAIVVLTHDPKLDDPALVEALRGPAFYVGALGSLRTQQRRSERLAALGVGPEQLARIRGPAGLDIGAATPEEIALAILSEVVAVAHRAHSVLRTDGPFARARAHGAV